MGEVEISRILGHSYPDVDSTHPVVHMGELGDSVQALMYAKLFWPRLLEIEGAIFVDIWGDYESYIRKRLTPSDQKETQSTATWKEFVDSFNLFEVGHIFRLVRGPAEIVESVNRELGWILVESWAARLASRYPQRRFKVRFVDADEMMESRIEVSQESPPLAVPRGWSEERRSIVPETDIEL